MAAPPHRSFPKALLELVPRVAEDFAAALAELAGELGAEASRRGLTLRSWIALAPDPLRHRAAYGGTLEIVGGDAREIAAWLAPHRERIAAVAVPATSACLVGRCLAYEECASATVRYQYLMRAGNGFDHEAYLVRYRDQHAAFGLATPGTRGYAQLHVDLQASQELARETGFGIWDFDSVSEMQLESVEAFLAEVVKSPIPKAAMADEAKFVDRAASEAFCVRALSSG